MWEGKKGRDGGLQGQPDPRISDVLTRDYPVCCVALEVYTAATESCGAPKHVRLPVS